jgi:hypothetical protein
VTACAHPVSVSRRIWVRGTQASGEWQPPIYAVRVTLCSCCGALQPDASNSEVVSGNRGEEESSPSTED